MTKTWTDAKTTAEELALRDGATVAICAESDGFAVTYKGYAEWAFPDAICEVVTPLAAAARLAR